MIIAGSGLAPITRDGARAAAQRELSKAIYHRDDPPWPVRVVKIVMRWFSRLLDTVARHSPGGGAGALLILLVVGVVVAVAWWRVGTVRSDRRIAGGVLADPRRSAADHLRDAEAAAAAGRWHDAVIARMRALARQLEDDGVLEARPGRTADELAAEAGAARPDAAAALRSAARTFDDVAYGGRTATRDMYDVIVSAADAMATSPRRLVGIGR